MSEKLINDRIIKPVKFAEQAAPIVPVLKHDNSVHVCRDYELTVNLLSKLEQYPVPKFGDLFGKTSGVKSLVNWIWAINIKR